MRTFLTALLGSVALALGLFAALVLAAPVAAPPAPTAHYYYAVERMGCGTISSFEHNWQSCKLGYRYADIVRLDQKRAALIK